MLQVQEKQSSLPDISSLVLSLKDHTVEALKGIVSRHKYVVPTLMPEERKTLLALIIGEETIRLQLPSTIAITTHSNELRALIQSINRVLLPLDEKGALEAGSIKRRPFSIKLDNQVRTIECIYDNASNEQIKRLVELKGLVYTEENSGVIPFLKDSYINNFNKYFIRRRGKDNRWYLMVQIER